jgi:hypothetical protein
MRADSFGSYMLFAPVYTRDRLAGDSEHVYNASISTCNLVTCRQGDILHRLQKNVISTS